MMQLSDVRDWIATLGVAASENVYSGKLPDKQQKSIGVYNRTGSGYPVTALGGYEASSYDIKRISLLVHWTAKQREAESTALKLFELLRALGPFELSGKKVWCVRLEVPEPQDVGTDDTGIFEYVIWFDLIYER